MRDGDTRQAEASKLLERITGGLRGEDEQLLALAAAIEGEVELPADAFVIGEPVEVTEIRHGGSPRTGLRANCRRGEERYVVGLADVAFQPGSNGARLSAAYRVWLGLEPEAGGGTGRTPPRRRHKAESEGLDLSRPVELVVLAPKSNAIRCRLLGTEREITLRTAVRWEVPGEIVTVSPAKHWTHAGHPYLSGKVERSRLDVAVLGLTPLELRAAGPWDPDEDVPSGEKDPRTGRDERAVGATRRTAFELEEVIPLAADGLSGSDPIGEALDLAEAGDRGAAEAVLLKALAADLRCLDAHAHLGNLALDRDPKQAKRHYDVGASIGGLSLGAGFDGLLPWRLGGNGPFLRCLHGAGLVRWRLAEMDEAAEAFRRLLRLDPSDAPGVRFALAAIEEGRTWEDVARDGPRG